MIDPDNVPPIANGELLARYATQSSHFRKSDRTVKPNLFMPHPHRELSVTRHLHATEDELWAVGQDVCAEMNRKLYGRSDLCVDDCQTETLTVVKKPIKPNNPNHADISGWPSQKQDQKAIALKLAASASKLIPLPES